MISQKNVLVVGVTALAYLLLFELNNALFTSFSFSAGVNWIFLPSGLRLAFILVFGVTYVVLYAKIVRFKAPRWMVIRR